jgi:hypothetical protein
MPVPSAIYSMQNLELVASQSNLRRLAEAGKLADDPAVSPRKAKSRVTNGSTLFVESDRRGPWSRRFRDILNQIIDDVRPADGDLSEAQRQLARRCATIAIECEKMEGKAAAGEDIDLMAYGTLTDRLGRCFQRLGIKRVASDGRTLGGILRAGIERGRHAE